MNDQLRESLSALMDNEANELEIERILAQAGNHDELRSTWLRYNQAQQATAGHDIAFGDLDISHQVRQAIMQTDVEPDAQESTGKRIMRPLVSFGVAASVALAVVLGGQQLALVGAEAPERNQALAASPSPVGMVNTLGATTIQASYGTKAVPVLQPTTRVAYRDLAQQRMERYMQKHAEHAALNAPYGLVPFARVPRIEE